MGVEIERKFLVDTDKLGELGEGTRIAQGYFDIDNPTTRVRIKGDEGYITIKGPTEGLSRAEYEYQIPLKDAEEMLREFCVDTLYKTRHLKKIGGHTWEIDVFGGDNNLLTIAEIELGSEDEAFEKPEWLKEEVSLDSRYFNSNLAKTPFNHW